VRFTDRDGNVKEYTVDGTPSELLSQGERRVMDCMDCHNRPTHDFRPPEEAIDEAMTAGIIPRDLPFIRREAVRVLSLEHSDKAAALRAIESELQRFYREEEPSADAHAVEKAVVGVQAIYARNVFPAMKVDFGTYPNHIGHQRTPGCFRCHDGEHVSPEGVAISQDCTVCHHLLAVGENNPAILGQLYEP
jgi:hypothetical protein